MREFHDLKKGAAFGANDRRSVEIEKRRRAAQASALDAEFGFTHCDYPFEKQSKVSP
jgi:hypothetical protein